MEERFRLTQNPPTKRKKKVVEGQLQLFDLRLLVAIQVSTRQQKTDQSFRTSGYSYNSRKIQEIKRKFVLLL